MMVGILGGGQLGRMLALAGMPLGLRCRVLEPSCECPAAAAAEHVLGRFDDPAILEHFVRGLDVVTYEFENVPASAVRWVAERVPVFPPPGALEIGQDRIAEKIFFQKVGALVPAFAAVQSRDDLIVGLERVGVPAVVKTTRLGYDGKGQAVIRSTRDVDVAWSQLGGQTLIVERFIPFRRELSILGLRGRDGSTAVYPLVENVHRGGILRRSRAPAPDVSAALRTQAETILTRALEALHYVGVLAIEMFEHEGTLLVNEMAPRVHNSGHWTIEGAETSQFENHLRAIVGLPLGSPRAVGESVMLNLIGGWPEPARLLAVPGAHLHLYGKKPMPGRKVGHVTVRADSAVEAEHGAQVLEELIRSGCTE